MIDDVKPIRGDLFIDRLLGYTVVLLGLVVLGVAVARLIGPKADMGMEVFRLAQITMALIAGWLITRSSPPLLRLAAILFIVRLLIGLGTFPYIPKDRYLPMQIFFDGFMVFYCRMRIRSLLAHERGP